MLNVVFWIILGALVGWVIAILHNFRVHRGISALIIIGTIGGLAGGILGTLLDPISGAYHTSLTDIIFAVFGATTFTILASHTLDDPHLPRNTD